MICRDNIVRILTSPNVVGWEYFYPNEIDKLNDKTWVEKVKEFHKAYYGDLDAPLAYIVLYDSEDNIVSVLAITLFTNEFSQSTPEIVVVNVDEWLQSRNNP
jgi:hypothetical protein